MQNSSTGFPRDEPLSLPNAWDAVETYFECITTCSVDDGECITRCVEQLKETDQQKT